MDGDVKARSVTFFPEILKNFRRSTVRLYLEFSRFKDSLGILQFNSM